MENDIILDDFGTTKVSETEFTGECTANGRFVKFRVVQTINGKVTNVVVTILNPHKLPEGSIEDTEEAIELEFIRT